MEIRYLLQLLAFRWRFIAAVSLVAAIAGLCATFLSGEEFEATTTILIRPHREFEFTPSQKTMLDFPPSITHPPESISRTYAGVMTSTAVARRVVELLSLDQPALESELAWYTRAYRWSRDRLMLSAKYVWDFVRYGRVETRDPYWQAVDDVLQGLKAEPVEDTYLFRLTATWKDPQLAARIADSAANVFIEYTSGARRAEDRTSVVSLDQRLNDLKKELETSREQLRQFRASHETSSVEQQLRLKLENLAAFQAAHEEAANNAQELRAEVATIERLLGQEPEEIHASTTMAGNPVLWQLKEDLARDELSLASLRETLMPAHPTVKAMAARVEEAKERIAAEGEQIRFRDTSEINPYYREMKQRLLDRRSRLDLLEARVALLDGTIARYGAEIQRLSDNEAEFSRLKLEVEVKENEYRLLTEEFAEARLAALQEIAEIRALAPAIPPVYPSRPVRILFVVGGLLFGFMLSLCWILVADYTSPRIRTADDIARVIDAPVLAQLPRAAGARTVALLGDRASSETLVRHIAERGASGEP